MPQFIMRLGRPGVDEITTKADLRDLDAAEVAATAILLELRMHNRRAHDQAVQRVSVETARGKLLLTVSLEVTRFAQGS